MNHDSDVLISENLQTAITKKDDAITISMLQKNNKIMETELASAVFPQREILKANIDFNKMIIKRLQIHNNGFSR